MCIRFTVCLLILFSVIDSFGETLFEDIYDSNILKAGNELISRRDYEEKSQLLYYLAQRAITERDSHTVELVSYYMLAATMLSDDVKFISEVAIVLAAFGEPARPALIELFRHDDEEVRENVRRIMLTQTDVQEYAKWILPTLMIQLYEEYQYGTVEELMRTIGEDSIPALASHDVMLRKTGQSGTRKSEEIERLINIIGESMTENDNGTDDNNNEGIDKERKAPRINK